MVWEAYSSGKPFSSIDVPDLTLEYRGEEIANRYSISRQIGFERLQDTLIVRKETELNLSTTNLKAMDIVEEKIREPKDRLESNPSEKLNRLHEIEWHEQSVAKRHREDSTNIV